MNIRYHEAAVLTRVPTRRRQITLDYLHKHAWSLFCGGSRDHNVDKRPFIFRFDAFDDRRFLIMLRCDRPFVGSQARHMNFEIGDPIEIDWQFIPGVRLERKEWTPRSTEWLRLGQRVLLRAGLAADCTLRAQLVRYARRVASQNPVPVVNVRYRGAIHSESAFATAFLDGIGRKRGYGMGLIRIAPDSPVKDEKV